MEQSGELRRAGKKRLGYIRRPTSERRPGTIGRRTALKIVGVGAALVLGGVAAREGLKWAEKVATELGPSYDPSEVYAGTVTVLKGVNVRTSPNIPDPGLGNNTVRWENIEEVNGESLNGADAFEVDNPAIYRGFDPNAGRSPQDSPWIKLKARIKNPLTGVMERDVFINMGGQTVDFVKTPEYAPFIPLEKDQNDQLIAVGHGINLSANQIGIVRVNPSQ